MKNTKNQSMKKIVNLVVCSLVLVGGSSIQAATIGVGTAFGTFFEFNRGRTDGRRCLYWVFYRNAADGCYNSSYE